jgi:hypothetical protein
MIKSNPVNSDKITNIERFEKKYYNHTKKMIQNGGNANSNVNTYKLNKNIQRLYNCYVLSQNQNGGDIIDYELSSQIKQRLDKKITELIVYKKYLKDLEDLEGGDRDKEIKEQLLILIFNEIDKNHIKNEINKQFTQELLQKILQIDDNNIINNILKNIKLDISNILTYIQDFRVFIFGAFFKLLIEGLEPKDINRIINQEGGRTNELDKKKHYENYLEGGFNILQALTNICVTKVDISNLLSNFRTCIESILRGLHSSGTNLTEISKKLNILNGVGQFLFHDTFNHGQLWRSIPGSTWIK